MTLPKPNRSQLTMGLAIAIVLVIVTGLAWGFGQQLALARQMRTEVIQLEQALAAEQAHHDDLVAQMEHIKSDECVEQWARREARMTKPGEVAVVPVVSVKEEPAGETQPVQTPVPESRPFWVELRELLLGPSGRP